MIWPKPTYKTSAYAAAAAAFLAAGKEAKSQVTYTDIDPDILVEAPGGTYAFDLDSDGVEDFMLSATSAAVYLVSTGGSTNQYLVKGVFVNPLGTSNSIQADAGDLAGFAYPNMLVEDAVIDGAQHFEALSFQSMAYSFIWDGPDGAFPVVQKGAWLGGTTDKFLGLSFKKDGNTHYGWIRLDVGTDNKSFTVKDFAYEATPNTGITADILVSSHDNIPSAAMSLYSFGSSIYIQLDQEHNQTYPVAVFNMQGSEVFSGLTQGLHTMINLQQQPEGLYICTIWQDGISYSRKLYIHSR